MPPETKETKPHTLNLKTETVGVNFNFSEIEYLLACTAMGRQGKVNFNIRKKLTRAYMMVK